MPRNIPIGNGNMLISFDENYYMREFSYPYVGEENHTNGNSFMTGVWCDGIFHWIDSSWEIQLNYLNDSLVTDIYLKKVDFPIELRIHDCVDFHENIYLKKVTVRNTSLEDHDVRIFFTQDFNILGNEIGDTALYRPDKEVLVHYKNDRYFLINVFHEGRYGIKKFAIGSKGKNDLQGTYIDALDGVLSCNPIEQGTVDSVTGVNLQVKSREEISFFYYICAGKSWEEVCKLNSIVVQKNPEELLVRTKNYWNLWVNKEDLPLDLLPEKISQLYKKSLLILRTQIDNRGGILAANDSDGMQYNRDTYSYVWPRDGALVAHALDRASYPVLSSSFYNFCSDVICGEGYLAHKYTPSKNIGSSWHPWITDGKRQLPIQEDETALVIWAIWKHFEKYRDIEFIKPLYKKVIKNSAEFMCSFIDPHTGLPKESYDLWEERLGVHSFTVASVYGGLIGASNFVRLFGEKELAEKYKNTAETMKMSFINRMYIEDEGYFARMARFKDGELIYLDKTVDSSLYSLFAFGMFSPTDKMIESSMQVIMDRLWINTPVGGIARYEDDPYYRVSENIPGNPWVITTLWMAFYYIEIGNKEKSLELMDWVSKRALLSGVLSEQINPYTNEPVSVSPLTWSHATFIEAVQRYMEKFIT